MSSIWIIPEWLGLYDMRCNCEISGFHFAAQIIFYFECEQWKPAPRWHELMKLMTEKISLHVVHNQ